MQCEMLDEKQPFAFFFKMGLLSYPAALSALSILSLLSIFSTASSATNQTLPQCLSAMLPPSTNLSQILFSRGSSSYTSLLEFSLVNPLFDTPTTPRPLHIVAPTNEPEFQAAVVCSKQQGLQIRVRSGGHDYEGLSYVSQEPFLILDLINYRAVDINLVDETAWVQAGATTGEMYYRISEKSPRHGFPAGVCTTLGLGGHFSGGGIGLSMRKFGLSIDNIIDARVVTADGRVLDRKTMGEGLFWAIRGGGAASFGVVLSWRIKLARVPPTVTVFTVTRTLEEGATRLMTIWQRVAPRLPNDIVIRVLLQARRQAQPTVGASFNSLFLGRRADLLKMMNQRFPELGLKAEDCQEMSWVESTMYFDGYPSGSPKEALLNRTRSGRLAFKAKSDFVQQPMSEQGLEKLWEQLLQDEIGVMILEPLGGKVHEVSEFDTPFPHRKGNLYNIQYFVNWENGAAAAERYINWARRLYSFMTPYVTMSPRGAYLNYRDLDLGRNQGASTSYAIASEWALKYFKGNFPRLAIVKGAVDRDNFFRNEQSIPPVFI